NVTRLALHPCVGMSDNDLLFSHTARANQAPGSGIGVRTLARQMTLQTPGFRPKRRERLPGGTARHQQRRFRQSIASPKCLASKTGCCKSLREPFERPRPNWLRAVVGYVPA